ncbi:MAG TPA: elongation factor P [Thermoanaerobaculia bacterium]|nr:elongation factor P [Thermoanaerobaculia bacterium]HUM29091.1 elongation factor P [Thermoanaerobaculia bacterium]HXK67468.1 elongation factor P [Thermoanaerobaculia bacterium]
MIVATQIRAGNILVIDGELFRVIQMTHVTPGKGHAHVQVKIRNLKTGNAYERRYNSGDKVEKAMLDNRSMQYLYSDASGYHFMDQETYEQIALSEEILSDSLKYLKENDIIQVDLFEGNPVGIEIQPSVILEVVETEPPMKGATAAGGGKPAKLENGITVTVPQFIQIGDKVKVDTRDDSYLERA